ncbi:MAG: radical SAM family heme chaperone HemW [Defluviitaleaceae bacterium]|nr:radical SAM family heme chaperone HemW [Defluviitaleaceae bacterium]
MTAGVYVHIPFCVRKCAYCDFLSFSGLSDLRAPPYIDALLDEISRCDALDALSIPSVFLGGGTPSVLDEASLSAILNAIARKADISAAEITLEANPGSDANRAKLSSLRSSGFNRLSIGLQAAQDGMLAALGRSHTLSDFLDIREAAASAGFRNINADVMFGLPGQTPDDLAQTIGLLVSLDIPHISAYSLTIEDSTPFGKMLREGAIYLPDEDAERRMYAQARQSLAGAGYTQYEISNFARLGRECIHNILYWTRQNYLGFGLGAHSLVNNTRWRNTDDMHEYIVSKGEHASIVRDAEDLDTTAQMEEFIFLGLRMTNGISAAEFHRQFGVDLHTRFGAQILKYQHLGLLEIRGDLLRLTPNGVNVSNIVLADFL